MNTPSGKEQVCSSFKAIHWLLIYKTFKMYIELESVLTMSEFVKEQSYYKKAKFEKCIY